MGRWKEDAMENEENHNSEMLAAYLGVNHDELIELEYHVEEDTSNDGALYGFTVYFPDDTPQSFIDQLSGFDHSGYYVSLPPHWGEERDDDDYNPEEDSTPPDSSFSL